MSGSLLRKILFIVVAASIAAAFVSVVWKEWDTLRGWQFTISILPLTVSMFFGALAVPWYGVLWKQLIDKVYPAHSLTLVSAMRTSTYTWLGRYTPGKAVSFMGRVYMEEGDTPRSSLHVANAIGIMYGILSPILISTAFLLFSGAGERFFIPLLILGGIGLVAVALLDSPYPYKAIRYVKRLRGATGEDALPSRHPLGFLTHAKFIGKYAISDVLRGVGFVFLVFSFVPLEFSLGTGLFLAGALTFAVIIGVASIIAPAGVGVREGALVFLLSAIMPAEIAVAVALAQRVWELAIDGILFFAVRLLPHHKKA